jgi:hypothetical protein
LKMPQIYEIIQKAKKGNQHPTRDTSMWRGDAETQRLCQYHQWSEEWQACHCQETC